MKRESRPLGVTVIAVLYGISTALLLIQLVRYITAGYRAPLILTLAVLLSAAVVWGLLEMAAWGRSLALYLTAALFIFTAVTVRSGMINGEPSAIIGGLIRIIVQISTIAYLLKPEVAVVFRRA